jgi:hypothetical protein
VWVPIRGGVLGATDDGAAHPSRSAQLYWHPRELIDFTERSTTTLTTLQSELEPTRERGYATDEGEVHPAVLGLAVLVPGRGSGEPSFGRGAETRARTDRGERRSSAR